MAKPSTPRWCAISITSKAAPLRPGFTEILYPGEPEARMERQRSAHGIPVDDTTWQKIEEVGARFGLSFCQRTGRRPPTRLEHSRLLTPVL